jgi:ABC-type multidrug transport system fused ATPase/permease subunit
MVDGVARSQISEHRAGHFSLFSRTVGGIAFGAVNATQAVIEQAASISTGNTDFITGFKDGYQTVKQSAA